MKEEYQKCKHCSPTTSPLNGVGANTGNGRLHSMMKKCECERVVKPFIVSKGAKGSCDCVKGVSVQFEITPSEQTRIDNLKYGCYGSAVGVTQSRVRELLDRMDAGMQYGNEGTRISRLQQKTDACSSDSVLTRRPIISPGCPPLPPPPAPPARSCPLTKNQK
jgi:hypothetical protein